MATALIQYYYYNNGNNYQTATLGTNVEYINLSTKLYNVYSGYKHVIKSTEEVTGNVKFDGNGGTIGGSNTKTFSLTATKTTTKTYDFNTNWVKVSYYKSGATTPTDINVNPKLTYWAVPNDISPLDRIIRIYPVDTNETITTSTSNYKGSFTVPSATRDGYIAKNCYYTERTGGYSIPSYTPGATISYSSVNQYNTYYAQWETISWKLWKYNKNNVLSSDPAVSGLSYLVPDKGSLGQLWTNEKVEYRKGTVYFDAGDAYRNASGSTLEDLKYTIYSTGKSVTKSLPTGTVKVDYYDTFGKKQQTTGEAGKKVISTAWKIPQEVSVTPIYGTGTVDYIGFGNYWYGKNGTTSKDPNGLLTPGVLMPGKVNGGWFTKKIGGTKIANNGAYWANFENSTDATYEYPKTLTYYAHWGVNIYFKDSGVSDTWKEDGTVFTIPNPSKGNTNVNPHSVVLDGNGGTVSGSSIKTVTIYDTRKPKFLYYQGSDGNRYQPGDKYSKNASLTLTAVWEYTTVNNSLNLSSYPAVRADENIPGGIAKYTHTGWTDEFSTYPTNYSFTVNKDFRFVATYSTINDLQGYILDVKPCAEFSSIVTYRNNVVIPNGTTVYHGEELKIKVTYTGSAPQKLPAGLVHCWIKNIEVNNGNATFTLAVSGDSGISSNPKVIVDWGVGKPAVVNLNHNGTWQNYSVNGDTYRVTKPMYQMSGRMFTLEYGGQSNLISTDGVYYVPKKPGNIFIGWMDEAGKIYNYNSFACDIFTHSSDGVEVYNLKPIFKTGIWLKAKEDSQWHRVGDSNNEGIWMKVS